MKESYCPYLIYDNGGMYPYIHTYIHTSYVSGIRPGQVGMGAPKADRGCAGDEADKEPGSCWYKDAGENEQGQGSEAGEKDGGPANWVQTGSK